MFKKISENYMFYAALVFLIFPVVGILSFGYPLWYSVPTGLFAIFYITIIHAKKRYVLFLSWFYLLAYIGLSTFFINGNMYWFIFYLSNLLVYRFNDDLLRSYRAISFHALVLLINGLAMFSDDIDISVKLFSLTVTVLCYAFLLFNSRSYNENLLQEKVMRQNRQINWLLAENERNRISQDLHDTLGHVFASLSVQSELVSQLLELKQYDKAQQASQQVNQLAKQALFDVRHIVQNLKHHSIEEEIELLKSMLSVANVHVSISQKLDTEQFSAPEQSQLSMILRELGNNLIKHAKATECQITLSSQQHIHRIVYEDNGIGFENVTDETLQSLKDRAANLNGSVEILSWKKPTVIQVTIVREI